MSNVGQTILHAFQVFTTENPMAASACSMPAIVVLGRISEPDEPFTESRWSFLFIGALEDFHQRFVSRMEREFDQGKYLDRRGLRVRGADFVRQLNRAIEQARQFTGMELRKRGILAVTWSEANARTLGIIGLPMIARAPFMLGTRYGFEVRDNADAKRIVLFTLKLKQLAKHDGHCDPLRTGHPMRETPGRLEFAEPPAALEAYR